MEDESGGRMRVEDGVECGVAVSNSTEESCRQHVAIEVSKSG
jgi:hypothetical protein